MILKYFYSSLESSEDSGQNTQTLPVVTVATTIQHRKQLTELEPSGMVLPILLCSSGSRNLPELWPHQAPSWRLHRSPVAASPSDVHHHCRHIQRHHDNVSCQRTGALALLVPVHRNTKKEKDEAETGAGEGPLRAEGFKRTLKTPRGLRVNTGGCFCSGRMFLLLLLQTPVQGFLHQSP